MSRGEQQMLFFTDPNGYNPCELYIVCDVGTRIVHTHAYIYIYVSINESKTIRIEHVYTRTVIIVRTK